jgi:hypothetical protein
MSKIEQALYDYLSPRAQKEVDDYLSLDDEAIDLMVRPMSMLEPYDYKTER